jgi:ubiquinol-cytochrome c reductase cytochrome b subunit
LLWAAGGNDILADKFHISLNAITYFMRGGLRPAVIAFIITRRWCISLQRHDNEVLLHGYETGIIMRSPDGGYSEKHFPISEERAYTLTARERDKVILEHDEADANGVAAPGTRLSRLRARLSRAMYGSNVQKPTAEELEAAKHHGDHDVLEGSDSSHH